MSVRKAKRRPKAQKATERPTPPAERLAIILKLMDEHANTVSRNPLSVGKGPLEIVAACKELAKWQFRETFEREGSEYVWLMLTHALTDAEAQLKPLLEAARDVARDGAQ